MSNLVDAHRFYDVPRSNGVLLEVNSRQLDAAAHIGIRLQVKNKIAARHFSLQPVIIEHVGTHHPDDGVPSMMADELWPAGAEVVINRYVRPVSYKLVDYVAPDKARSASYERPLHSALPASIQ
jgi:hypothetical protein